MCVADVQCLKGPRQAPEIISSDLDVSQKFQALNLIVQIETRFRNIFKWWFFIRRVEGSKAKCYRFQ